MQSDRTPEDIAKGLTKAQYTALWNLGCGSPDFGDSWRFAPHDGWRRAGQACTNLVRKDLAEKYVKGCGIFYRLTPLGQQVRAILNDQS